MSTPGGDSRCEGAGVRVQDRKRERKREISLGGSTTTHLFTPFSSSSSFAGVCQLFAAPDPVVQRPRAARCSP